MAQILSAEKKQPEKRAGEPFEVSDMLGDNAQRVDSIIGNVDRVVAQFSEEEFAVKLRRPSGISTIWWPASRRARARWAS